MIRKPTKTHVICYVLGFAGPLTRHEALQLVQLLQGKPYVQGSHTDYFKPTQRYDKWMGPVARGLVRVAGQKGRFLRYEVTEEGRKLAREYEEWRSAE